MAPAWGPSLVYLVIAEDPSVDRRDPEHRAAGVDDSVDIRRSYSRGEGF